MSGSLRVHLGPRSHDIVIGRDSLASVGEFARRCVTGDRALVVADVNVEVAARKVAASLEACGMRSALATVPPGEAQKSLAGAMALYDRLIDLPADRRTLVVAVGGGVVGDLAGFVAATYARGLPLLMIPTTLLAMVDSSVGGKVAVNHPRGKNMIGVFHQPVGVWIDTALLATLPDREYRSGLAEVVKYGVSLDAAFFSYLEANVGPILARQPAAISRIVEQSCRIKAGIVEQDEREETGLRAILNYGHTFAHAFETAGGYSHWLHGEAVAAGMACACMLALRRGLVEGSVAERQQRLLEAFGLPTSILPWPVEGLLQTMRADKKALGGQMRFVLPLGLGEAGVVDDVAEQQVREVLEASVADASG